MQMTGATAHQLPANRSPPTPMVQTPVGAPTTPPVFPKTESEGVSSSTTPACPTELGDTTSAEAAAPPPPTQNHVEHGRTVSQSSGASSSVPELVPANSAINNN